MVSPFVLTLDNVRIDQLGAANNLATMPALACCEHQSRMLLRLRTYRLLTVSVAVYFEVRYQFAGMRRTFVRATSILSEFVFEGYHV